MSILIQCPHCGRELKLPDRRLLGRKGKCPKCSHSFVLQEVSSDPPEPANLETTTVSEPPTATSPQPAAAPPAPAAPAEPTPSPELPFFAGFAEPSAVVSKPDPSAVSVFAGLEDQVPSVSTSVRLKPTKRSASRIQLIGFAAMAVVIVIGAGVAMWANSASPSKPPAIPDTPPTLPAEPETISENDDGIFDASETSYAKLGSPTQGKPIELRYIPFGSQVVINLHPAALWQENSLGEELRQCVPSIAVLIETTLNDVFKCRPEQVAELLICLIPGPRGSLPDLAAVAHLSQDLKPDQLSDQFGPRAEDQEQPVYLSRDRAYVMVDLKTLAVCPKSQIDEMIKASKQPHPAEQLDPLLARTDRDRQLTILFTPQTLGLHDAWFPEAVRPFVKNAIDWLGDQVDAVEWDFHQTPELFYSEFLLRGKGGSTKKLEPEIRLRLDGLAEKLVPLIHQMDPDQEGKRMVIGRLPAMVEVYSMATIASHGPNCVQFVTSLPDRAAPNLFLATQLAWEQSTRTDFTKAKPISPEGSKLPATVAERLKTYVDVDFRATPFSEAFAYISSEIKTPIELDGDALKAGGFTKNIKQTFKRDAVRVQDVIMQIFEDSRGVESNPEKKLVVIIDETNQTILITTLASAKRKGLTPFALQ